MVSIEKDGYVHNDELLSCIQPPAKLRLECNGYNPIYTILNIKLNAFRVFLRMGSHEHKGEEYGNR
jgi:hypothetical protein